MEIVTSSSIYLFSFFIIIASYVIVELFDKLINVFYFAIMQFIVCFVGLMTYQLAVYFYIPTGFSLLTVIYGIMNTAIIIAMSAFSWYFTTNWFDASSKK